MSEAEQPPPEKPADLSPEQPAPPSKTEELLNKHMTRRAFLKNLGVGVAAGAVVATPLGEAIAALENLRPLSEVMPATPETRLHEAGLGEFTDLWQTYDHYQKKYGDAVKKWPLTGPNHFPVTDTLVDTLSSVASGDPGSTNTENTTFFASEWGTKKDAAEPDARKRISEIKFKTGSTDPRNEARFRNSLTDLVPVVPAAMIASPEKFALADIDGASYSPEQIAVSGNQYQFLQGKYYAVHELMHSLMNDNLKRAAPYIDKKAFADFITTYFGAVAKTADQYFDASFEEIAGPQGLLLYNISGKADEAVTQVKQYEELLQKHPEIISPEELWEQPIISQQKNPHMRAVYRYNQLAQIAGKAWQRTMQTDPTNAFLADTEGFMVHIFDDIAHRYVVDNVKLSSQNPSVYTQHAHDVWNSFLRTFSTIGPDANDQRFHDALDYAELENTGMVFMKYGSTVVAESKPGDGSYTPYRLHKLPAPEHADRIPYFFNFSEYGIGSKNGSLSALFSIPSQYGELRNVRFKAVPITITDELKHTDTTVTVAKILFDTEEGEKRLQVLSNQLGSALSLQELEVMNELGLRPNSERPTEIPVITSSPYDVTISMRSINGDQLPAAYSQLIAAVDIPGHKKYFSLIPGVDTVTDKALLLSGVGDQPTNLIVHSPGNGPSAVLEEWQYYPFQYGSTPRTGIFKEQNGAWVLTEKGDPRKWGFTVLPDKQEEVRKIMTSPDGVLQLGLVEDPTAPRPTLKPQVSYFFSDPHVASNVEPEKYLLPTNEVFLIKE